MGRAEYVTAKSNTATTPQSQSLLLLRRQAVTRNMSTDPLCRGKKDGEPCDCGLTQTKLTKAGVGIFDDCRGCGHKYGSHPAGLQGK
jgi:hypothetical protein